MFDTLPDSDFDDLQHRTQCALLAYEQQKLPHWPTLSESMVRLVLQGADGQFSNTKMTQEVVRLPETVVRAALLWAYTPPSAGFMSLPDGKFLTEQDLAQWLVHVLGEQAGLSRKSLVKGSYADYVQERDHTLRHTVLSSELRYVEVPLALAGAILDWYHIPETGSFENGPSVEDVCEELSAQAQAWSQVSLEDNVDAAFEAVSRALKQGGVPLEDGELKNLSVED